MAQLWCPGCGDGAQQRQWRWLRAPDAEPNAAPASSAETLLRPRHFTHVPLCQACLGTLQRSVGVKSDRLVRAMVLAVEAALARSLVSGVRCAVAGAVHPRAIELALAAYVQPDGTVRRAANGGMLKPPPWRAEHPRTAPAFDADVLRARLLPRDGWERSSAFFAQTAPRQRPRPQSDDASGDGDSDEELALVPAKRRRSAAPTTTTTAAPTRGAAVLARLRTFAASAAALVDGEHGGALVSTLEQATGTLEAALEDALEAASPTAGAPSDALVTRWFDAACACARSDDTGAADDAAHRARARATAELSPWRDARTRALLSLEFFLARLGAAVALAPANVAASERTVGASATAAACDTLLRCQAASAVVLSPGAVWIDAAGALCASAPESRDAGLVFEGAVEFAVRECSRAARCGMLRAYIQLHAVLASHGLAPLRPDTLNGVVIGTASSGARSIFIVSSALRQDAAAPSGGGGGGEEDARAAQGAEFSVRDLYALVALLFFGGSTQAVDAALHAPSHDASMQAWLREMFAPGVHAHRHAAIYAHPFLSA